MLSYSGRSLCYNGAHCAQRSVRWFSVKRSIARKERCEVFVAEKTKRLRNIGVIEKIKVEVDAKSETSTLFMNKYISTPHDCAKHVNLQTVNNAGLAVVNEQIWDMHRPLVEDCKLEYLFYTDRDSLQLNKAYWRSCSFLLGYMLETCLKDDVQVQLHSWPAVDYNSGSFIYDAVLGLEDWKPSKAELNIMGRLTSNKLKSESLNFEPLNVELSIAMQMFKDNPFKLAQLPMIADSYERKGFVPVYCLGDHVDISKGPMISSTCQLGYFAVTNLHKMEDAKNVEGGCLYRVQGVSVPFTQKINSWTWNVVCEAGARPSELPFLGNIIPNTKNTASKSKPLEEKLITEAASS